MSQLSAVSRIRLGLHRENNEHASHLPDSYGGEGTLALLIAEHVS